MNKVKVITDSCADPCKELREKYDIDYALMSLIWDGKEIPASCDQDLFTYKQLYDAMRDGKRIITQQVSDPEFERIFTLYLEQGYDIVYIACSSALSGSYNLGQIVAKRLMEKYEGQKIICVDPKNSVAGELIVAIEAAKVAALGAGVEEVAALAEAVAPKAMQFAAVGDLTYLKRAGRVKATAAFFGNLFGIKPILISNRIGENEAIKKVKGRKNSLDEIVNMLAASLTDEEYPASEQTIFVVHADCEADANYLAEQVKTKINPKEVYINAIGPTIGASVGPETVALYAFGNQYATIGD
ncbi:MAG: DegV family protein [Clostridiales bacterium]|nr:DegV family protein [Clostridiales bacterium]